MAHNPALRRLGRAGTATLITVLVLGATILGTRAASAYVAVPETGVPGYLTLHTRPAQLHFGSMSPGMAAYGQMRIELSDAPAARLSVQAYGDGSLFDHPDGITMTTRMCDAEWTDVPGDTTATASTVTPICADGERAVSTLTEPLPMAGGHPSVGVGTLHEGNPRYLLVELHMPPAESHAGNESLMGLSADFAVQVSAEGDRPTEPAPLPGGNAPGPTAPDATAPDATAPAPNEPASARPGGSSTLATTGFNAIGAALCAIGAMTIGLLARRRRRPVTETHESA
jgi:hypothetical protein